MCMPALSPWMKRFIFGFQRRVWWPNCTPASSSCFMVTTAMLVLFSRFCVARAGRLDDRVKARVAK